MKSKLSMRIITNCITLLFTLMIMGNSILSFAEEAEIYGSEESKLSDSLAEKLRECTDSDMIQVWIWFNDISNIKIDHEVEKITGLKKDDFAISKNSLPKALDKNIDKEIDSSIVDDLEGLKQCIQDTKQQCDLENEKVANYLKTQRMVTSKEIKKHNTNTLKKLEIPSENIIFQSLLTPSSILTLSKSQILDIIQSDDVVSIELYEEPDAENCPPNFTDPIVSNQAIIDYGNDRSEMRVDEVLNDTGLTGDGVNILVFDHGWVRSDISGYNDIDYEKVHVVFDKSLYDPVTNIETIQLNDPITDLNFIQKVHPNIITRVLQFYAPNTNIYSVNYAAYSDVEWTICNFNINAINGSINFGSDNTYNGFAAAKWCDYIINKYNIIFMAAGGNDEEWMPEGWPYVIAPGNCYNCITVGAYDSSTGIMRNYRYNPTNSTEYVNYKPDIVVPAPSTSEGTPMATGTVSLMLELNPSLTMHPDLIKAILMASCHNKAMSIPGVAPETMSQGLTQRQGAGAIDAYTAINIVLNGQYGISEVSSNYDEIALPYNGDDNMNISIAWLYTGIYEDLNNRIGDIIGTAYTIATPLQELELEVYDNNQNLISDSAHKNTGKQLVYFEGDTNDGPYTVHVKKDALNVSTTQYAYAWSSTADYGDTIIQKDITVNNALSNSHTMIFEPTGSIEVVDSSGAISNHHLIGTSSLINNSYISVDGEVIFTLNDVLDTPELLNITGSHQLTDGSNVGYIVSNTASKILITLYDVSSVYINIDDSANLISYYDVRYIEPDGIATIRYTESSYISSNTSSLLNVQFYDAHDSVFAYTPYNQISFLESTGYVSSQDTVYRLTSSTTNGRASILMSTFEMGDVTMDGVVDEVDSITLLRYIVDYYSFIQTGSTGNLTLGNGNITVNGNISANGAFTLNAQNANINGQLSATSFINNISGNLNLSSPLNNTIFSSEYVQALFSDEQMNNMFFSGDTVLELLSDYIIEDTNIALSSDTIVYGDVHMNGNVNVDHNLKATGDIFIIGDVSNTINGIIYSQQGDITLDSNNINYSGFIYAPEGTVTIEGNNITITGAIIAKELIIEGNSVNFNIAAVNQMSNYGSGSPLTLSQFQLMLGDMDHNQLINIIDVICINRKINDAA